MTEIPIVVSTNEITVGGVVDQIELQLGLGEKGDRGSRIFSGDVSPLTLPANSPFFSGYTEFKPGDVYVERSATNIAMWEWKSQPGGYTWVKTADIAVSGGGGMTSLDPDLTAIADITGTTGLLRKSGVNTWILDTNSYLTSNQTVTLSGDVTGSGSTAITTTLANSGVSAGTYNDVATQVRPFSVDSKGRITSIGAAVSINIAQSAVTNLVSDLALKAPLASPALTGTPTAPTAAVDTSTTQLATTAYVVNQGYLKSAAASSTYLALTGGTLTGKVNTVASAAGSAGFNLPHGAAPTSPTNGDVWTTTAGMYVRVNGTTVGPFGTGAVWGSITGTLSSQTDLNAALGAKLDTAGGTLSGNLTVNAIIYGNNPGSTFQSTTGSEIALQLYESTGSSTMLYSTGDGYLGWVGRRKTGSTRRYAFESNPSPSSGANFGLWLYDSAGANSKGVWYATYNTSLLPANLTFDSSTTFNNPINANSIVPISGTLSLNYGSSAFDAVRSGQLQVVREGVGANNTLFATYPTNAALVADAPNFIVFGSGAFSGTGTGTVLSTTNSYLKIDGGAGYERQMQFLSGGSLRWTFGATSTAESGSNAGSIFSIARYSDTGVWIDNPFEINRSTGLVNVKSLWVNAGGKIDNLPSPTSNNEPATKLYADNALALKAPLASPTFTGTPAGPTASVDTNTTQLATTAYVVGQGYLKSATASSTYLPLSGGTVTGNINMNSASPSFIVSGTSGGTSVYIDAVPGQWSQVMFRNYTGYKNRWALWKDNVSESGSNAGSDLWLTRYDDNGSSLGEVFGVYRATGKITFRAVDSSAGLELGSNGPRIMVGTGTPEGSVTAPVGSEWTDTNTGIKYAKMAGTGTTGWSPQTPISQQGYVEETQVMMMMGVL